MKRMILIALVLAVCVMPASAFNLLKQVDKLDTRISPGYGLSKFRPLHTVKAMLVTAKVYERSLVQLRLGCLAETKRNVFVFGIDRDLLDLGELLDRRMPIVGLWMAGEVRVNYDDAGKEDGYKLFGMIGVHAVMIEY